MPTGHEYDAQLDIWGAKVYCGCGLTFAVRYPGVPAPNEETPAQREQAHEQAVTRWREHLPMRTEIAVPKPE